MWVVPAIWSSNYLIARAAAGQVPPHLLAFGRWAVVLLVLLCWCGPSLWTKRAALRREAPHLVVLGALGMWICGAWVYLAGQSTSATNIGLIYAIAPIGIAIGGSRLLGQRLSRRQCWSMGAALLGVLVVVFRGDLSAVGRLDFTAGDLWIAAAAGSWVAYSLLLQVWKTALTPVERLCASCAAGVMILAPFAAVEWMRSGPMTWKAGQLIVLAALLPGLISYLAYAFMQKELGVARTSLMLYLGPVYAAVLAWIILGEAPGWFHALGAMLILPGIRYSSGTTPRGRVNASRSRR